MPLRAPRDCHGRRGAICIAMHDANQMHFTLDMPATAPRDRFGRRGAICNAMKQSMAMLSHTGTGRENKKCSSSKIRSRALSAGSKKRRNALCELQIVAMLGQAIQKYAYSSDSEEDQDTDSKNCSENLSNCESDPITRKNCESPNKKEVQKIAQNISPKAKKYVSLFWDDGVLERNFDIFQYSPHGLHAVVLEMFYALNLIEDLNIRPSDVTNFVDDVSERYHAEVPYHNFTHAVDVCNFSVQLLCNTSAGACLSPKQKLCLVLAALCHDAGHEGFNNAFLKKTAHPWTKLYGIESTLEHYHASQALEILEDGESDVFGNLSPAEREDCMSVIETLILSTDLATHRARLQALKKAGCEAKIDSELVMCTVLGLSDISNVYRPWNLSEKWALKLKEELELQAKCCAQLGITENLGPDTSDLPKMVLGFMNFIVTPLHSLFCDNVTDDFSTFVQEMSNNNKRWSDLSEEDLAFVDKNEHDDQ
jgi:hypothetical protein